MAHRRARLVAAFVIVSAAACSAGGAKQAGTPRTRAPRTRAPQTGSTTQPSAPSGPSALTTTAAGWQLRGLHPASPLATTGKELLVTTRTGAGGLLSVAIDAASGKLLWSHTAIVRGRLGGMGLQAPTPIAAGAPWQAVSVEPGGAPATNQAAVASTVAIVGRDARTGSQRWTVGVTATFGPQPCGRFVCFDDQRVDGSVTLEAVDPITGQRRWAQRIAGQADLDTGTGIHTLVLRLGTSPVVADLDPATGRPRWQTPIAAVLGAKVTTDGGWSFRRVGGLAVVLFDPYRAGPGAAATPSGLVALDLATGAVRWKQPGLIFPIEVPYLVDPPASPAAGSFPLLAEHNRIGADGRSITALDLVRLDPATGVAQWTAPLGFAYAGPEQVFGGLSPDGDRLWLRDPTTRKVRGIDLATGRTAASTGDVWVQAIGDDVSVANPKHSYVGPPQLHAVTVPALHPAASRLPPATLTTASKAGQFWIDDGGTVHAHRP